MERPNVDPYRLQVASDIIRDGLDVELVDLHDRVIAEVFRCDKDKTVQVITENVAVPLRVFRRLIDYSYKRLDPFEDGTPLEAMGNY